MKPGITGLWQVSGRSNIEDFEEVVKLDVTYIDNWSLWNDIKILFKTVYVVFAGRGAKKSIFPGGSHRELPGIFYGEVFAVCAFPLWGKVSAAPTADG